MSPKVQDLAIDEILLARTRARIAERIRLAMRRRGFPATPVEAYSQLSTALGWDISVIVHLVSGKGFPTIEQLIALSEELKEPLSFFVDEREEPLPTGTAVIEPIDSGESLVLRLPTERLPLRTAKKGLVYFYALRSMGFAVDAGDLVVATRGLPDGKLHRGRLYVFDDDGEIELRLCVEAGAIERAVFKRRDASKMICPMTGQHEQFEYGEVVAVIRSGKELHELAAQSSPEKSERPTP